MFDRRKSFSQEALMSRRRGLNRAGGRVKAGVANRNRSRTHCEVEGVSMLAELLQQPLLQPAVGFPLLRHRREGLTERDDTFSWFTVKSSGKASKTQLFPFDTARTQTYLPVRVGRKLKPPASCCKTRLFFTFLLNLI